jgi:hypothetical protein
MIWFACPQCGKVHGRPENAVGAMVFCTCGHGLTVPWESTTAEPVQTQSLALPAMPAVEPLSFGGPPKPAPPAPLPPPRASRRRQRFEPNPDVCLNHEARPKQKVCAECGLSFCDDCVVTFRGQSLCGPCKNYEAKLLQQPARTSVLAIVSVLVALIAGLMVWMAPSGRLTAFSVTMVIAVAGQALAFLLGLFALRLTRAEPRLSGQGLAVTGMAAASVAAVFAVALSLHALRMGI